MSEVILLDTNAWVHGTRLMRAPLGAALLQLLEGRGARLVLPEVVETELLAVVKRDCGERAATVSKSVRELGSFLGRTMPDLHLPTEEEVAREVQERLTELEPVIQRAPLTLAHTRSALARVIARQPPADRSEEFRDALIWEVALDCAKTTKVWFVTQDKAFYAARKYEAGLAKELLAQSDNVIIAPDVQTYLDNFGTPLPLRVAPTTVEAIDRAVRDELESMNEFPGGQYTEVLSRKEESAASFPTETPGVSACEFSFLYSVLYAPGPNEAPEPYDLRVKGEAFVDPTGESVRNVRIILSQLNGFGWISWDERS